MHPANVVRKYEEKGWKGFKDFLWSAKHRKERRKFMSYENALSVVKTNNISNKAELNKFLASPVKPDNFPNFPDMVYQRKGWVSFDQFFK